MNKFLGKIILTLSLLISINLFSQVKMGENPNVIEKGALLELESTNKVLRVTRIQNIGDTSILLGKKSGMVVYIESEKCLFQSDGNSWKSLCENIKANGKSVTSGSLIVVSGSPSAAVLDSIHIDLNINQLKDSMAKWMSTNPIIDSMMANIIVGNGLTKNPLNNSIELGGVLTKPTIISTNSTNTFALTGLTDGVLSNNILIQDPTTGVIRKISSSAFANGMIDSVLKSTKFTDSVVRIVSTNSVIIKNLRDSVITSKIFKDSVTSIVSKNTEIIKNITDSIEKRIQNGEITGNDLTSGSPTIISVTGGAGATLLDAVVNINMNNLVDSVLKHNKFKDSVVSIVSTNTTIIKNLRDSIVTSKIFKDSVTSIVSTNTEIIKNLTDSIEKRIQNGEISGNNLTSTNPNVISITGGAGATLLNAAISINMKNITDSVVSSSIFKDSVSSIVSKNTTIINNITDSIEKKIQNGEISGNDLTSSKGIIVTGGNGSTLLDVDLRLDSSVIAKMVTESPIKDSILTTISKNINNSPLKDSIYGSKSFKDSVTNIVSKDTTIINNITDSIEKKIQNGEISGKNMTSGSLVSLTGTPAGSLLQDVKIDIDATKMKDSIASWINDKPISDSISKFVSTDSTIIKSMKDSVFMSSRFTDSIKSIVSSNTTIVNNITDSIEKKIQNGEISGNDLTSSKGIIVTGGNGSTLLDVDLRLDSSVIAKMVTESPIKDSILTTISKNINNSPLKDSIYGSKSFKDSVTNIVSKDTTIINNIKDSILSSQSFRDSLVKVLKDSTTNVLSYDKTSQILTSTVNGKTDTTIISTASKDSTIARNGLTQIKDTVELGGTLIKPTTITTSSTNTLSIAGLQSGKKSDSIMTDSAGVVRHRSLTSILTPNWIEITSNYTVQDENIVLFTGSSDATLTLPSAAANPGRVIQILNYAPEGSVVNLTMSPALRDLGSDTGSVLSNQLHYSGGNLGSSGGNTLKIFSNGTNWFKLSN